MSTASRRASFRPDVNEKAEIFMKHGSNSRIIGRKRLLWVFTFRPPKKISSGSLFSHLGAKVGIALSSMSLRRKSSHSTSSHLVRSRSVAEPVDAHRAEAIEDCIEFLHSSLSRSISVSTSSC